jgi:hypothetical protein
MIDYSFIYSKYCQVDIEYSSQKAHITMILNIAKVQVEAIQVRYLMQLLALVTLILPIVNALQLTPLSRRVAAACIAVGCFYSPLEARAGIAALDAATRAMTATREKTVEERQFSQLPEGAKKRAALNAWYI